MSYHLVILRKAQIEMSEAIDWYEQQQTGLGKKFILSLESFIKRISLSPFHFPEKSSPFREAYLKKFPYLVIYQVNIDEVVIYSVFHVKQYPDKKYL